MKTNCAMQLRKIALLTVMNWCQDGNQAESHQIHLTDDSRNMVLHYQNRSSNNRCSVDRNQARGKMGVNFRVPRNLMSQETREKTAAGDATNLDLKPTNHSHTSFERKLRTEDIVKAKLNFLNLNATNLEFAFDDRDIGPSGSGVDHILDQTEDEIDSWAILGTNPWKSEACNLENTANVKVTIQEQGAPLDNQDSLDAVCVTFARDHLDADNPA